jgi:hypothetical protein
MGRSVTFDVRLRTHSEGAYRRLRRMLKTALRRDQLRAIDVRERTATKISRCSTAQAVRTTQGRRKGDLKMKMTKYASASFIGTDDVEAGPIRGTIAAVDHGSYDKAVITFSNGMRFSLNKTNVGTLIGVWGDESDDWVGERLELFLGTVRYKNEDQPSVLVRPLVRAAGEKKVKPPKPKSGPSADIDDPVLSGIDDHVPY